MGLFSFRKKEAQAATPRRGSRTRTARTAAANEYSDHEQLDPLLPEKQRARRRLVGALALVLAAVIILPMVLDSEPKPVTSDIAVQIPGKNANLPPVQAKAPAGSLDSDESVVTAPANGNSAAPAQSTTPANRSDTGNTAARTVAPAVSTDASQGAGNTDNDSAGQTDTAARQAAAQAEKEKAERAAKAEREKAEREKAERQARADKEKADRARAQAALADKANAATTPDKGSPGTATANAASNTAGKGHFVIRIGAFSDQSRAQNWLVKLKLNDVPSYVETRKTSDGRTLYLLRSGPFKSRESAEAAGKKVRQLGLTAQIAEAS